MSFEGRIALLALALKFNNDWQLMLSAIQSHDEIEDNWIDAAKNFDGSYITMLDKEYPERLKRKPYPPFVLYYDGDISILSRVDENDGKNKLIFLHGPNTIHIPDNMLVAITPDNKLNICGVCRVWFNKETTNICRFGLAAGIAHNIVCTKTYDRGAGARSWFNGVTVPNALALGANIFYFPTTNESYNNDSIREGAILFTSLRDIYQDMNLDGGEQYA